MGNIFEWFASGLGKAIGNIFHAPVDFLAGKSCSSVCAPTWDVTCYIENFCIVNLLKLALMLVVLYVVFLSIYLTYKLKVFHCIFKTAWGCCSTCFCTCSHCCHCLFQELSNTKRRPRRTRMSHVESFNPGHEHFADETSLEGRSRARRHHKRGHLIRKSLRARSHRVQVGIRRNHDDDGGRGHRRSMKGYLKHRHGSMVDDARHGVRVTRTTRFAHKGFGSSSSRRLK